MRGVIDVVIVSFICFIFAYNIFKDIYFSAIISGLMLFALLYQLIFLKEGVQFLTKIREKKWEILAKEAMASFGIFLISLWILTSYTEIDKGISIYWSGLFGLLFFIFQETGIVDYPFKSKE